MGKKIRGVSVDKYVELMHDVERGLVTDEELVKKKILLPSTRDGGRGIAKNRDNKVFKRGSKIRGKRRNEEECLVPHCLSKAKRRGLCNTHRTYAYRMIQREQTTEANLIDRNLMLPKASGGDQTKRSKKKLKKRKKKLKKHSTSIVNFPKKMIETDRCLYPKCKRSRKGGGRGLCTKHYSQYKRKRNKLPRSARKRLDRDLIKRRLLLPPQAKVKKQQEEAESSAFEIGSTIRGSIRRY